MKTKITLLILFLTFIGYAQNGINYKAVIKNDLGNVVAGQNITIRFTILQGAINTYQETHDITTDSNGIVIVNIGEGTVISGTFSAIVWGNGVFSLNTEIDLEQNGSYDLEDTTAFKTVPYAILAGKALTTETIELPFYEITTTPDLTPAFYVHNTNPNSTYAIFGSTGDTPPTLSANRAGVFGYSTNAHGVYGRSQNSFYAGVQGVSNSATGVGIQGYGAGGGVGGHFYTTSNGVAALTTGTGNVGIGIDEPEEKLHVGGDLFVQTNLGSLKLGLPNNGDQWRIATIDGGENLLFRSKPDGSNTATTRFRMDQSGEFLAGTIGIPEAWLQIRQNSTINKQHILLQEVGTDYARLGFTNTTSDANWDIAGLPSNTTANARLNFYFRNANGAANRLVVTGDGEVGINGSPTARLELYQQSQSVGTGLRFPDGTANSDWDITHGFALRFHYGGSLRGFINANTGAYTQSSDASLKANVNEITSILNRVNQLRPTSYYYKDDASRKKSIGFIAQEVEPIFPEVVHFSEADNLYGVDYAAFGVIAIKAIQEQQSMIENQQKQIDELKALVTTLLNKN